MNNNEILESIKKAFKLTIDKLDNHYMFYLDEMVTPKLITLFYWILLFAFITKGLGDIFLEGRFLERFSLGCWRLFSLKSFL